MASDCTSMSTVDELSLNWKPKRELAQVTCISHRTISGKNHRPLKTCDQIPPSSESLLSPNRALRAALLKSRFADTILRAQEKCERGDPEKLQRELKDLKRKQREDKERRRIEAQAKVTEKALKQKRQKEKKKRLD